MAPQAATSKPSLEAQQKLRMEAERAYAVLRSDLELTGSKRGCKKCYCGDCEPT